MLRASWRWLRDRIPFRLLLPLYYLDCRVRYYPPQDRIRRKYHLPLLDEIDLTEYKHSDTLFVLGSGPSINRISPERWQAIAAHDSVGFNFWPYHPFRPTFYFTEGGPEADQVKAYKELSANRADYAEIPKIITDLHASNSAVLPHFSEAWRKNLFAAYTIPGAARTDEEFAKLVSYLAKRGVFSPQSRLRYLFKHCATLSSMVVFGVKLQYKRIVLCGVDLTSSQTYYHDKSQFPTSAKMRIPSSPKHITMIRHSWATTPIDVVLYELNRQVLRPAGIQLYVEHDRSALYPNIPLAPDSIFTIPSAQPAITPGPSH